jgi:GT2 family glycosyltransferase
MTRLAILIVSWNTRDLLEKCLLSIFSHPPGGQFEVRVVDNGSKDGSAALVREKFPQVHLVENRENVGFAQANNQAIRASQAEYVLLLNPDTEIRAAALETLLEFMDSHPQVGGAGPLILNPDGSLQTSCYPAPNLTREIWRLFHLDKIRPYGQYDMQAWDRTRPRAADVIQGACLILRSKALAEVGLLDEAYFIYSEEVDLCYRLRQAGWRLVWVPQAEVVHYGGQATQQVAEEMFLHLYKSKILYFKKHQGVLAGWLYKLILLSAAFTRLLFSPLAWLERRPARERHLNLAKNYRRLVLGLLDR